MLERLMNTVYWRIIIFQHNHICLSTRMYKNLPTSAQKLSSGERIRRNKGVLRMR